MPQNKKKTFLCIGNKKQKKCVFSNVELVETFRPLYANSQKAQLTKHLSVYCNKKHRIISKAVYKCSLFINSTLFEVTQ